MIHGITVKLEVTTETGKNAVGETEVTSEFVDVPDVLVGQPTEREILDGTNLEGRKATYILGIPKGDAHEWTNKRVRFFGAEFRAIGAPVEGIDDLMPLRWNKKVRVENVNEL